MLQGRDILENDRKVLLVSREAAKLYWGENDPIGRRAALPFSKTVLRRVIGIVGDVKQRNLIEASTPTVYFYTRERYGRATFAIRTSVPPATLVQPAVAAIHTIDREQPVGRIRTMAQAVDGELTSQRFSAMLLGVFAGVALLLAGTEPRDRDPSRAWRAISRRASTRNRRGHVARARRHRGRNARRAGLGEGYGKARFWRERIRSANACWRRGNAGPCCPHCQPGARVPRPAARPGQSPARGVVESLLGAPARSGPHNRDVL